MCRVELTTDSSATVLSMSRLMATSSSPPSSRTEAPQESSRNLQTAAVCQSVSLSPVKQFVSKFVSLTVQEFVRRFGIGVARVLRRGGGGKRKTFVQLPPVKN